MTDDVMEGQVSLFDVGMPYMKTSQVPCHREKTKTESRSKGKTSDASSKNLPKSSRKMPLYLDLTKDSGHTQDASWETLGVSHGLFTMHSTGEFHSEENGSVCLLTLQDSQHPKFCLELSIGEAPREPNPTKLSEILETENVDSKYVLSPKACNGILTRANRRGKQLPELLRTALENQIGEWNE